MLKDPNLDVCTFTGQYVCLRACKHSAVEKAYLVAHMLVHPNRSIRRMVCIDEDFPQDASVALRLNMLKAFCSVVPREFFFTKRVKKCAVYFKNALCLPAAAKIDCVRAFSNAMLLSGPLFKMLVRDYTKEYSATRTHTDIINTVINNIMIENTTAPCISSRELRKFPAKIQVLAEVCHSLSALVALTSSPSEQLAVLSAVCANDDLAKTWRLSDADNRKVQTILEHELGPVGLELIAPAYMKWMNDRIQS